MNMRKNAWMIINLLSLISRLANAIILDVHFFATINQTYKEWQPVHSFSYLHINQFVATSFHMKL